MNIALLQLLLTFGARLDVVEEARVSFCHRFWVESMCDHAYLRLMLEYGLDLELYITSDIIRNHFFGEMLMCEDKKVAENCMVLVALYLRSNELRASSQGLEVLSKFDALKHKFQLVDQTEILGLFFGVACK